MTTHPVRRLTRAFGVATVGFSMLSIPLYFVYDGPPPVSNVLMRTRPEARHRFASHSASARASRRS